MLLKSNCDLISEEQVIATAKLRLGIDDTSYDMQMKIELANCLRTKIKTPSVLSFKQYPGELCNKSFKLPVGFQSFLGLCLEDDYAAACEEQTGDTQRTIPPLLLYFPLASQYGYPCCDSYYIENGYLYVDAEDQEATLSYIGLHTNSEGTSLLIYDTYEDVLANYLCYMFLLSNPTYYDNDIYRTKSVRQEYHANYIAAKNGLRGAEQRNQWNDQKGIMALTTFNRVHIANYEAYMGWVGTL